MARAWVLIFAITSLGLSGCVTTTAPAPGTDPGGQGSDPNAPASVSSPGNSTLSKVGRHAQSAVEGLVFGAAIGAQAGPIGAAVGAGTFLIYGALTGHSPLSGGGGMGGGGGGGGGYGGYGGASSSEERREEALEQQIEQEVARADVLEDEITEELRRQEALLDRINREEATGSSSGAAAPAGKPELANPTRVAVPEIDPNLAERADPRAAPPAPKDRDLPLAIFEKQEVVIPKGQWDNKKKLDVTSRSLDADQDGQPEQVRYYDESGEIIRKEQDQNYDGQFDTWNSYRRGSLAARALDSNGDGTPDAWETYETGRMTGRQVDRDYDGVRDAFYEYKDGDLVSERHDSDNDGNVDLSATYRDRQRIRVEQDRNKNGVIDMWTSYHTVDGVELMSRIEKDDDGSGKPDVFETYTVRSGKAVLAKREEDKNGDGNIDVTSIYQNGKLVRREITDPNMVPL